MSLESRLCPAGYDPHDCISGDKAAVLEHRWTGLYSAAQRLCALSSGLVTLIPQAVALSAHCRDNTHEPFVRFDLVWERWQSALFQMCLDSCGQKGGLGGVHTCCRGLSAQFQLDAWVFVEGKVQTNSLCPFPRVRRAPLPCPPRGDAVVLSPEKPDMFTGKRDWGVNFRCDGYSYWNASLSPTLAGEVTFSCHYDWPCKIPTPAFVCEVTCIQF